MQRLQKSRQKPQIIIYICLMLIAPQVIYAKRVFNFPEGKHFLKNIISSDDNVLIKGEGSGISILYIPEGIYLSGKEPRIKDITLIGSGSNTGITLKNNYRVLIENVEIQNYALGLKSICENGSRQWLHTYRDLYVYEGINGFKPPSKHKMRGIELIYSGKKTVDAKWKKDGGFSIAHTFWGGRIATRGTPLLIDGPHATSLYGMYIDISDEPLRMTKRSRGLQLFGTYLDRNTRARKNKVPIIILEDPKVNQVIGIGNHYLDHPRAIVDGNGNEMSNKYISLFP